MKKQIKLRTTAYPEFFIRSLMDHSVDVRTKMILHSAFSNETTVEVRELFGSRIEDFGLLFGFQFGF
ncbi:hypothetical protein LEP1GSC133_3306 [Leptospira borgpetersenii serovar Pomona str. 200901868]|uniref:Uncharacterized protein n=1 Tax=Leptospira borgpetersenii serovar Pomona str. 200901868 TaxID=1192866 RepID=M6VX49_LEPBO|nr:hypothetical protein LEP1GSC133_3306 [Leptospira borgpetersenii serovar Pomona str. 200901868]